MSKIFCKCGSYIHDNLVPNPQKFDIVSDGNYYDFFDKLNYLISNLHKDEDKVIDVLNSYYPEYKNQIKENIKDWVCSYLDDIYIERKTIMYKCDNCSRLVIAEGKGENEKFTFFVQDM